MILRNLVLLVVVPSFGKSEDAFSMEEVAQHNTPNSCWTVIDESIIYDITDYASNHPNRGGGSSVVYQMCGIDGTALYDRFHADERHYLDRFSSIKRIGTLSEATEMPVTSRPTISPTAPLTNPPTTPPTQTPTVQTQVPATILPTTKEPTPVPSTEVSEAEGQTQVPTEPPTSPDSPIVTESPKTTPPPVSEDNQTESPTPTPSLVERDYVDLEQLSNHNIPEDCWVAYFGNVYDMTLYAPTHPKVGPTVIYSNCGEDGTDAYASVHPKSLLSAVDQYMIAPLGESSTETDDDDDDKEDENNSILVSGDTTIGIDVLSLHDSIDDCWIAYYDKVYNMTQYAYRHPNPPGEFVIHMACGSDGTIDYASIHSRDLLNGVEDTIVGKFDRSSSSSCSLGLASHVSLILALALWVVTW